MELFDETAVGYEADDVDRPLVAWIRAKKLGHSAPPYIPKWERGPLCKLGKLALLWKEAGFEKEARELAHWLFKWEPFFPLWCPEKEYHEQAIQTVLSKLRGIEPLAGEKPGIDIALIETAILRAALTLDGDGTSLGVIRMRDFQIQAFGPQNGALCFGIQGKGVDGWTRIAADPAVWLEMKPGVKEEGLILDIRLVGIEPEAPLFFAFYVKAGSCQIANALLKPKSLSRFQGEAKGALFDGQWTIETGHPHKVQLIPLAGGGCFWDADFLLSFEIPPFAPQMSFFINKVFIPS